MQNHDTIAVTSGELPSLFLKSREERRLRAGHVWVYSNEIDVARSPLKGLAPGSAVTLRDSQGKSLGSAYVNPNSLIAARVYSSRPNRELATDLLRQRIQRALVWRERAYGKPFYRLAFGESDGLPGLVVDRYGDVLSVQLSTAGMDARRDAVIAALEDVVGAKVIVLRNDSAMRELENLPLYSETVRGEAPELVTLEENGVTFSAPLLSGQKTGWFYDHRDNRARVAGWAKDRRVLDVFSYAGAWGVLAAAQGAKQVTCVDSSAPALHAVEKNARANGVDGCVATRCGDAFEVLRALREEGAKFDIVVLDPPAFIKRKKDHAEGLQAYRQINKLALGVLADDGILVSASCSHHLLRDELLSAVRHAAIQSEVTAQLVAEGQQALDHPIHPAIAETQYLKSLFFRVTRGRD